MPPVPPEQSESASAHCNGVSASSSQKMSPQTSKQELLDKRARVIGSTCQIFYKEDPLCVARASGQYIYDENGEKYLDCISNVQHVGHCHPVVVETISAQLASSTCNARFVSPALTECAERILETLPGLDTVLFVNSGSEANDLALRLARDFSKHEDLVVLDHAYHGHLTTTMQMSPYKFDHGATPGKPEWIHVAPVPDVYRGLHRLADSELRDEQALSAAGLAYSQDVASVIQKAQSNGRRIAGFISEALQSCGGQVIPPRGYFLQVAEHVHAAGGVMILDEVQTGYGRVGSHFWAYKLYDDGFVPDIVTMGKPMGNGFPVSAVVTRREISDKLGGGVGYFNTYGGNPVSCAAVLGVLRVLQGERLIEHSARMAALYKEKLEALKEKHQCIGDVRGVGQFWGIDLVESRETRVPAASLAASLILKTRREFHVLLSADGPHSNIIKLKPPLCFDESNLNEAVAAIDKALTELGH